MDKQDYVLLKRKLISDKRMKHLHEAFTTLPHYSMPTKELMEEVTTLHTIRKTRGLNSKKVRNSTFVQDLIDGMIDDGSKRSRLVEILMECVKTIRVLDDNLDDLQGYLLLEYSHLIGSIRTKGEREQFIETQVFTKYRKYSKKLRNLKEACEFVIQDIDKFAYTYRNLVEAAKLVASPTRNNEL